MIAGALAEGWILVRMALRNLIASRLKTVIVGGIVFMGAILVVVGTSLLDSVDDGMSRSIVGSVAAVGAGGPVGGAIVRSAPRGRLGQGIATIYRPTDRRS